MEAVQVWNLEKAWRARAHMGLDRKTPAQMAGLDLGLNGIRWKELIKQAVKAKAR